MGIKKSFLLLFGCLFLVGCQFAGSSTSDSAKEETLLFDNHSESDLSSMAPVSTVSETPTLPIESRSWMRNVENIWAPSCVSMVGCFSPNGKWYVISLSPLKIIRVDSPDIVFEYPLDVNNYDRMMLISWSPDGNTFVLRGDMAYDCPREQELFFFQIDEQKGLEQKKFELPPSSEGNCLSATWSPDGQRVAVIDDLQKTLYMLAKDITLLYPSSLDKNQYNFSSFWTDAGLFIVSHEKLDDGSTDWTEIRLYSTKMNYLFEYKLIEKSELDLVYMDTSPDGKSILLGVHDPVHRLTTMSGVYSIDRLWIVELPDNEQPGTVIRQIPLEGRLGDISTSTPSGILLLQVNQSYPHGAGGWNYYRFDWNTRNVAEITGLEGFKNDGWKTNINGFLFYDLNGNIRMIH